MAKVKINITLEDELLKELDEYCDKNFLNRSWAISQALVGVLNQQKLVDAISNVSLALRKCSETGVLDENTKREMETFESLSKLFIK